MVAIDKVAPIKERRIKHNSQEWFDGQISEAIKSCDKLLKKVKRSRLHIDKKLYSAARYKVHKMIFNKKKDYFENKLNECNGKSKYLVLGGFRDHYSNLAENFLKKLPKPPISLL